MYQITESQNLLTFNFHLSHWKIIACVFTDGWIWKEVVYLCRITNDFSGKHFFLQLYVFNCMFKCI